MISDIRLQHFRSYEDETFEFAPSVNIIVGPNGSGKTNLLEAVLVLARGSSYRVKDSDLIAYDQPWARLDAHLGAPTNPEIRTLKLVQDPGTGRAAKTYDVEGKQYKRLVSSKVLPAVIFEPNHLYMLTGSPELRRSYLDDLLEQIDPGFGRARRDYKRVLVQRNTLLKRYGHDALSQIFPWNLRLSELGGQIAASRLELIDTINDNATELYGNLAHRPTEIAIEYVSKLPTAQYATTLLKTLESQFELDVARGFTGAGPHRDDMNILLRGRASQITASRGETRTAVLMLKVMELRLIEQARDIRPMLLLDDVFSELDGARRQALTNYLRDYQTYITTTDADVVVHHFMDDCRIIPLGVN